MEYQYQYSGIKTGIGIGSEYQGILYRSVPVKRLILDTTIICFGFANNYF